MVRFFERRDWLWGVLLIAFVFIAYAPVFHAGFVWDDESHLTQNPCIVGPLGLKEIWTSTRAVYYPLVLTTFWTLHKFVGLNPLPYHILNVLMHAGSAVLLWRVLRQLGVGGAWLGAALWALHPVMVQSVAWVTELKNTQSCLFYLLSISFFLNWEEKAGVTRVVRPNNALMFGLSLACFVLATLSKPSVVMLPVVLALCVWWRRGRIGWKDAVPLAPFLLISALASAWTIWEQKFHASAIGPEWAQTWPERLIIAGRAIWFYLAKLFWPHPLIFIYPRWEIHPSQLMAYVPLLAAVVSLIFLWLLPGKAGRAVFFAAAYYVISLFPVLGFFSVYFFRYSFVSDHFQYLASMGPIALASAGVATLARVLKGSRKLIFGTAFCVVVVLAVLTWRQSAMYGDIEALWRTTLVRNPACWMAYNNLGLFLYQANQIPEAMDLFKQSLRINPDNAEAHNNLGNTLLQTGRTLEAIDQYKEALRINHNSAHAHNNLGNVSVQTGRTSEAIDEYKQALLIDPDYADAHNNLGNVLYQTGRTSEAIDQYEQALRLNPNYADAHNNLGNVLYQTGRTSEAIDQYEQALRLNPNYADAHNNLGTALFLADRPSEAIDQYEQALRINPNSSDARSNLGAALGQMGRISEAIEQFKAALRINPNDIAAQNDLKKLQALEKTTPAKK
ncbi:MAG: tetratricopeptide repeat protein [Verrucomicrobia bacterium]|nr:MAG: tetratricopeptide repeat protein [Verrucomicrobiota bacterium]